MRASSAVFFSAREENHLVIQSTRIGTVAKISCGRVMT
jgi:hypothetical protein